MAQNYNTAEKELLRTIEGGPIQKKPFKRYGGKGLFTPLKEGVISSWNNYRKKLLLESGGINIDEVNRWLKVVLCVVLVWLGVVFFRGFTQLENIPRFDLSQGDISSSPAKTIPPFLKPIFYYTNIVMRRNIFLPPKEKEVVKQVTPSPTINQMVKDFHVVGISWADDRKERFVMIEDGRTHITYYLREGDKILDLTVKRIYEDKVVISYKNKEVELH